MVLLSQVTENGSEDKLTFLLLFYRNLLPTLPDSTTTPTDPLRTKFSHPNLSKSFPLFFHRVILFESLGSLTVSVALCCVAPWSSAPRLFCLLKVFGVELAHDTHYMRTGANPFPSRRCLSPGFCSPKTEKSQLTPETSESPAAGVGARVWAPALIYCTTPCSSAL